MHEFFHGWRRKAGIASLLMAIFVMGFSVRSRFWSDQVSFAVNGRFYMLDSSAESFWFDVQPSWGIYHPLKWTSDRLNADAKPERRPDLYEIHTVRGDIRDLRVALWPVGAALGMLSAYWIVWPARWVWPERVVIGVMLLAVVYGVVAVWIAMQQEWQVRRELSAAGAEVGITYQGPDLWRLLTWQESKACGRIGSVRFMPGKPIPPGILQHLRDQTNVGGLIFNGTLLSDEELESLIGFKSLEILYLENTQTTLEGRKRLGKAMPKCSIQPDY